MQSRIISNKALGIACLVGVFLLASAADARTFRMNGHWTQNIGVNFQQPIVGGIDANQGTLVNVAGSSPATLTIPVNGFFDAENNFNIPIPLTSLVQISTMFSFFGPPQPGTFSSGPKTSRPVNFQWCPGAAANPACLSAGTLNPTQGTKQGRIAYTAGANQFGGTMRMLSAGLGAVTRPIATAPTRLQHNPVGAPIGIPVGNGYASVLTTTFSGGPITTGAVCANGPCGSAAGGAVIVPGTQTSTGSSTVNVQSVMPWTTGMISVNVTDDPTTATSPTFTLTGSDARTNLGAGNLTLVAGGLLQQIGTGDTAGEFSQVTMTFNAQQLPSISPPGLAAMGALIVFGAGYALRRRMR
jgi:hypothetical protein